MALSQQNVRFYIKHRLKCALLINNYYFQYGFSLNVTSRTVTGAARKKTNGEHFNCPFIHCHNKWSQIELRCELMRISPR